MTRYYGVDHSSTTLAEAAAWCRDNAIEERDYSYRTRRRRAARCTCNSLSVSPCDYCSDSDDTWCYNCENHTDECVCNADEEEEE